MADVVVVGAGAAGCMAALAAAAAGASVEIIERNGRPGRKLYITGKGRCNLTNDCAPGDVIANTPRNGRFLQSCVNRFPPKEVQAYFTALGVPLKTERGNRVFPCSDRSADIIDALVRALRRAKVELVEDRAVSLLLQEGTVAGVRGERGEYPCKAVILATGGASYPATGSTGDGYRLAAQAGHTIEPICPSLVPLETEGEDCARMQGLSLRNVGVKVKDHTGKVLFAQQGELLFTHFGLSGPLILSASAHMREYGKERYEVHIDLKPALDEKTLDARLVRELSESPNRILRHVLETLEPRLLVPVLCKRSGIAEEARANAVTREERRRLLTLLKDLPFAVKGPRGIEEAIVTSGGVRVKEVEPGSMASKRARGLYLAGELLDVDAYTGGFNLQIAWSTGRAAGAGAATWALGMERTER